MTAERETIDMTALGLRPTFKSAIYFSIDKHNPMSRMYPAGDMLEFLNTKPVWEGYFPEEVGHTYQDLCLYVEKNQGCIGGLKIDVDGSVTSYTLEQLNKGYDPREEK